jgi:hypothetical protein
MKNTAAAMTPARDAEEASSAPPNRRKKSQLDMNKTA